MASLWAVGDRSAGPLMLDLYRRLEAGVPKDEALQRVQVAAVRAGQHPLRWAAFQLYGDWR